MSQHYRTQLNNLAAQRGWIIQYANSQSGPLNDAVWLSVVYVSGYECGRAVAKTKGRAQEIAASLALAAIAQGSGGY
ncbi:hypothetical protein C8J57DRAFT_1277161 [Mycena rebaudengoi]|nr:hypothetical protein C8J57DRAFT_1277161 [Mycena rebaudengoi]